MERRGPRAVLLSFLAVCSQNAVELLGKASPFVGPMPKTFSYCRCLFFDPLGGEIETVATVDVQLG